ncbi:MAG: DEAD/DEAH box helicase [Myxococcota bacterium]
MSTLDPFAGVPAPLRIALERRGFTSLTPVQQAVLDADTEGQDLRISSQTGSGKTVALGLALARAFLGEAKAEAEAPSTDPAEGETETSSDEPTEEPPAKTQSKHARSGQEPEALVIAPTRELAVQVADELRWLLSEVPRTRVEVVTGGTDIGRERRMLRRPPRVLVGTPGRLLDHIRNEGLSCAGIRHVALDEADRMLDMGFREELEEIIDTLPKERRSHLVSATFSDLVRRVANRFQSKFVHLEGTALGAANDDIDHIAQLVQPLQRYAALVNALLLAQGEQVLVFVDRRAQASELAEMLAGDGFAALPFSGDLSQAQRTRTLYAFRTSTIQVLVSTDVAARGIDVPNISMVVHMAPPSDPDGYTHRSGRTGRAGRRGRSLIFVPPRGQRFVSRMLDNAGIEADWQPVPSPKKVRKAITKRTRRQLHERLDSETGPAEKTLEYATHLLENRDAARVVASLLEMAEPRLPREPIQVEAITPMSSEELRNDRRHDRRDHRPSRGPRGPHNRRGGPRRFDNRKNRNRS